MARRGWGASIAAALGVAAGAGAAQLGFGYGLGIINWAPTGTVRVESAWVASLAWATWIAATSVIAGAVCAQRLRGGGDEPVGVLPRLGLALAAGVGALVTVLLVAVPARAARVPDTTAPQTVAAAYAAAGLVLGVLLATWALHTRAAATNLIATTGWLWLLAVVSVVDGVLSGRGLTTAQLGIWQISADSARFWIRDYFYWPGALLSLGSALVIGVLAARRATRSPRVRVGAAASGAAGPLLVALAYLLAVPRLAGIAAEQLSAHLIAPYAVIAGVGGSMLMAALAQRADRRGGTEVEPPVDATATPTGPDPAEPAGRTPQRPVEPEPVGSTSPSSVEPEPESTSGTEPAGEADPGSQPTTAEKPDASPGRAGERPGSPSRAARTGADRRGRAVPQQRQPGVVPDRPAGSRDEEPGPGESGTEDTPAGPQPESASPIGEPKTRRRAR
ncbi:hypothetical protein [Micromonospora sp. AKA38]|uniref:hypothetical protein n=1 Tax=Micromonospora sp. AKA38 TaxID=2733861 RepID=UPI0022BF871A|nr:hypothetical protein [Micromonospora sp. AKA38]GHJ12215.1 hypothetical protein TPA0908_02100 [Micromonospora sp. AKA38]